jgi:phosphoglycerate dehydrogenase-like enzyme
MPVPVALLDDYQDVGRTLGPWEELGDAVEVTAFRHHIADDEALVAALEPFAVVVAMRERTPFTRERLARLPNLRLLVTTGRANASIDVAAASSLGVVVCGTEGVAAATYELTWALILAVTRGVVAEDRAVREGGWQHTLGVELAGRTLGVAGLGRLGRQVARIGQAFEMRVIAWSQNLQPAVAAEAGVEAVSKERLLAESDVLTVHLRLSERTRGLFGAGELALMKRSAYLVNTSRGPIVDETALVAALRDGTIAGAALDVYDDEPLPPSHPLLTAPNTVLTPHIGYVARSNYEVFWRDVVEDVSAYLAGAPIRVVSP